MNNSALPKLPNQLVGNAGLFYVCYELSKKGWNCLPTSRNAKGIDLVIYSQDANKMHTVQVKALSRKNPVPFGKSDNLIAEFLIVCILNEHPDVYVLRDSEVSRSLHKAENEGRISYWLEFKSYVHHLDHWEQIGTTY